MFVASVPVAFAEPHAARASASQHVQLDEEPSTAGSDGVSSWQRTHLAGLVSVRQVCTGLCTGLCTAGLYCTLPYGTVQYGRYSTVPYLTARYSTVPYGIPYGTFRYTLRYTLRYLIYCTPAVQTSILPYTVSVHLPYTVSVHCRTLYTVPAVHQYCTCRTPILHLPYTNRPAVHSVLPAVLPPYTVRCTPAVRQMATDAVQPSVRY